MDNITDTKNPDLASRILENGLKARPFGANIAGERAYTRAERCAAAIHLITNHVAASEPARTASRRGAIELLTHVLNLRNEMRSGGRALQETVVCIRKQISLTRLLSVGGFVSSQNAGVLVEALDELANILVRSQRSSHAENVVLKSDDFVGTTSQSISDVKRTNLSRRESGETESSIKSTDMRTGSILAVLKEKGSIGIKDISASLPEYSEKMIQRELSELVKDKRVNKTGSKRWSRYDIA